MPMIPPCSATPELFFSENDERRVAAAKAVCSRCPLALPCLDESLEYAVEGVWGSTTTDERKVIRARRGITAKQIITNPYPRQSRAVS